ITAILRLYLMPQWGWWHLPLLLYQILVFTGIWHLIKYINRRLNPVYPFERGPVKRMMLQNLITLLVLAPLVGVSIYLVQDYMPAFVNKQFQATMLLVFFIVILMFNFAFYSFHFFSNWQLTVQDKARLEVQAAELEKERAAMQYHQLKNQVNPHYLFNMLTSLDGLVHTDPDLASEFIRHMSKVYRYVLQHKESEVVDVEEELQFIGHYIELLQIRYKDGLQISINVPGEAKEKGVVMITLQMLIDNAIKHNILHAETPLRITVSAEEQYLVVTNSKQLRRQMETSNKRGLEHLRKLYSFHSILPIVVDDAPESYTIKVPLL
ncbi:MAG TPA: histidine kinase, partial [Flavipsychrobacter sp.]|nr:histidine kinase [Flavipsychrobacter sp.]